jgi:glyoxylase-like metal-dependent hydrolase (beta-lactamase superfamily II)
MWKVGSLQVVRVLEVELPVPRDLLAIGSDPEALLATSPWAVPALANEEGQVYFSLSATCVESQGCKIVIDPWISFDQRRGQPDAAEQAERQLASLGEAGFAPDEVDVVVSTHIDGVGWSTRPEGSAWVPSFPEARYLWTASEVERVLADGGDDATSLAPLLESGRVDRVEAPHAITSEVRLEAAPGHAPGNVNVWIESDGDAAVVAGDLILHPLQMADPDWAGLDMDGEQAAASRRALLADAEKRAALVIGPHFPSPGAFRVASDGAAWRPLDVPTTR